MANRTATISKRYRVAHDADVTVSLSIGAGQPGGWSLALDRRFVAEGKGAQTLQLGKGKELLFRELRIEFVIHDRRREHTRLIASATLRGGEKDMTLTHDKEGEAGDSATYTMLVQFI